MNRLPLHVRDILHELVNEIVNDMPRLPRLRSLAPTIARLQGFDDLSNFGHAEDLGLVLVVDVDSLDAHRLLLQRGV